MGRGSYGRSAAHTFSRTGVSTSPPTFDQVLGINGHFSLSVVVSSMILPAILRDCDDREKIPFPHRRERWDDGPSKVEGWGRNAFAMTGRRETARRWALRMRNPVELMVALEPGKCKFKIAIRLQMRAGDQWGTLLSVGILTRHHSRSIFFTIL